MFKIYYSDVDLGNSLMNNLLQASSYDGGAGFGWEDMTVYSLSSGRAVLSDLACRLFLRGTTIPESEVLFNIMAGVIEQHVTAGLQRRWVISRVDLQ
jgi:long-chain fatty acid transport protein